MAGVVDLRDVETYVKDACMLQPAHTASKNGTTDGEALRVMSWNVLAQVYTRSSWFPHSPPPSLKWKRRFQTISLYLENLDADIFLLQELDNISEFQPLLERLGYSIKYKRRTGSKKDGSAIAYRTERFECLGIQEIEYNELVGYIKDEDDNAVENRQKYHRDCIGILAALKDQVTGKVLCAASTHLFWDPAMEDVKLAQSQLFVSRIGHFARAWKAAHTVAGLDANSMPESSVYRVLTGKPPLHTDVQLVAAPFVDYQLRSAYVTATGRDLEFTTHIPQFIAPIDYVLHSPNLMLTKVLIVAKTGESTIGDGMPNYFHPSDHLPLGAEFLL